MSVFNQNPNDRSAPPERRPSPPPFQTTMSPPPAPAAAAAPAESAVPKASVLGKTLIFKGELAADEDLILQGRVEGSIHHTQSLTVGVDGVVIGDTHARSIVVEGTVEGDLRASVSVLVAATAKVRGNIAAPRVGITEGANFNGSVDMTGAHAAARNPDAQGRAPNSGTVALSEPSVERILSKP
jgi:cytoskeletal protein CcmA (bactofilin family)